MVFEDKDPDKNKQFPPDRRKKNRTFYENPSLYQSFFTFIPSLSSWISTISS
jgi:hypothetical protein